MKVVWWKYINKKLLEILVCPFDKVTSLDLIEFKTGQSMQQSKETDQAVQSKNIESSSFDSKLANNENKNPNENLTSSKNSEDVVEEGLLLCKNCFRFYPIMEEIPIILPDDLRDKKKDIEFLRKWKGSVPQDLLGNLKPWTV